MLVLIYYLMIHPKDGSKVLKECVTSIGNIGHTKDTMRFFNVPYFKSLMLLLDNCNRLKLLLWMVIILQQKIKQWYKMPQCIWIFKEI